MERASRSNLRALAAAGSSMAENDGANKRQLWGFSPTKVWKRTSNEPWAADGSCSLICRQGWFFTRTPYGKPACCPETRGSPYDNCSNGRCACDAQCRHCCDGN